VCTHDAGGFHRVGVEDLVASRLSPLNLAAILIFWRHSWRRLCPACGDRGWVAVVTNHVDALLARAPGSAGVVGDEPGGRACGGVEGVVPRREENVVALDLEGACEVGGVVAAQGVLGGEVAGVAGERFVDRDDAQLGVELFERGDRGDVRRSVDAAGASSRCERCACFWVDELAGDEQVGAIPKLDGELRPGFVEDQLD
jgi:hypothetical protein